MKKVLTIIAGALALGATTTPEAKADHYGYCGAPVYQVRVIVGYDCHGCPIYGYRPQPCAPRYVAPRCDSGYRGSYYAPRSGCSSGRGISISAPGFRFSAGSRRGCR